MQFIEIKLFFGIVEDNFAERNISQTKVAMGSVVTYSSESVDFHDVLRAVKLEEVLLRLRNIKSL